MNRRKIFETSNNNSNSFFQNVNLILFKVDNLNHLSAAMSVNYLLEFIKNKCTIDSDGVVY